MTVREGEAFEKGLVLQPFNSFIQASKLECVLRQWGKSTYDQGTFVSDLAPG